MMVCWVSCAVEFKKLLSVELNRSFVKWYESGSVVVMHSKVAQSFQPTLGYTCNKIYITNAERENILSYPEVNNKFFSAQEILGSFFFWGGGCK